MNSSSEQQRVSPYERSQHPKRMRESENDRRIVHYLYQYGLLSQVQFERLLELKRSTVQRLLRRLYDHAYIERLFFEQSKFGSSPALYILDRKGYNLLRQMGFEEFAGLPQRDVSADHLKHMLAMNEVHLCIEKACKQSGYTLNAWWNDNRLRSNEVKIRTKRGSKSISLIPDSYFSITVPEVGTTHCFLEVDRGSMDTARFTDKITAYVAFYKSGEFGRQFGAQGFRVLTVVDGVGQGRVINLRNASAKMASIGRRFWFTHLQAITPDTVLAQPIWDIAGSDSQVPLISLG